MTLSISKFINFLSLIFFISNVSVVSTSFCAVFCLSVSLWCLVLSDSCSSFLFFSDVTNIPDSSFYQVCTHVMSYLVNNRQWTHDFYMSCRQGLHTICTILGPEYTSMTYLYLQNSKNKKYIEHVIKSDSSMFLPFPGMLDLWNYEYLQI